MQAKNYPHIDGLRAVAVVLVVIFHAMPEWMGGGFIGVDVFFVISGFLISKLILDGLSRQEFSFGDFYARRVRRILPALSAVLAATWLFGYFALSPGEFRALSWHVIAGAGFFSNFLLWAEAGYFDTAAAFKPLLHLWSLSIEEQYYLAWPLILFVASRLRLPILATIAVALAASFAANIWLAGRDPVGDYYLPHARAWELLAGAVLARVAQRWPALMAGRASVRSAMLAEAAAIVGMAAILFAAFSFSKTTPFPSWNAVVPVGGTILLIAAGERSALTRLVLSNRLAVFVGLVSYPFYLWHWPLLSFARLLGLGEPSIAMKAGLVACAFALAVATYYAIERPIRFAGAGRGFRTWGTAAATALIGCVGAAGVMAPSAAAKGETDWEAAIKAANVSQRPAVISNCASLLPENTPGYEHCRIWNDVSAPETVVVWGDSHAHAWIAPIVEAAKRRNARVVEFAIAGCPPVIGVRRTVTGGLGAQCATPALADEIVAAIKTVAPDRIVIVARWNLYTRGLIVNGQLVENSFVTAGADTGADATAESSKAALLTHIPATLVKLRDVAPVTVFLSMPTLRQPLAAGMARNRSGFEPSLAEHRTMEAVTEASFVQAARAGQIGLFDPAVAICRPTCRAIVRGVPLYSDDNHVTEAGALMFIDQVERAIFDGAHGQSAAP